MKKLLGLGIIVLFMGFTAMASATPVDVMVQLVSSGSTTIGLTAGGTTYGSGVYTGYYDPKVWLGDTTSSANLLGTFQGFCVDYGDSSSSAQQYLLASLSDAAGLNASVPLTAYEQAAWLLGNSTSSNHIASQIAAWEVVFDPTISAITSGYLDPANTLLRGSFYLSSSAYSTYGTTAAALANDAISAVNAGYTAPGYYVLASPRTGVTEGKNYQDYLIHVPEPATLFLLGFGLLGLGLVGLKRKWVI